MQRLHAKSPNPLALLFAWTDKHIWHGAYASCSAEIPALVVDKAGKEKTILVFCNRLAGHFGKHRNQLSLREEH